MEIKKAKKKKFQKKIKIIKKNKYQKKIIKKKLNLIFKKWKIIKIQKTNLI